VARIQRLFRFEQASGLLMIGAMLLAFGAANSPLAPLYDLVHHTPIHLRFGPLIIEGPLVQWVNQGLMAFFFLLVGLEIKRQFLEGHLASAKHAALPAFAALGGMAAPAAIYVAFNWHDPALIRGWAIPTATDIVLALGVLSLLGSRVPTGLKVFLTALAIIDDIGAVLIIGIFYGESLSLLPLVIAGLAVGGLVALNALNVTRPSPYVVFGLVLWVAMLKSGVEAALAGALIGFTVPLRAPGCGCPSPLRRTERRLHPWCTLIVIPLFAFFNTGIAIDGIALDSLLTSVPLGVGAGLFIGKQIGVFGAAWAAVRLGGAQLPESVSWRQLYGAALLTGIGFTISLFVASLALADPELVANAKLAILVGSLLSAVTGLWLVHVSTRIERPVLRKATIS
jgi:NhaA family Na+:H+ antiporter